MLTTFLKLGMYSSQLRRRQSHNEQHPSQHIRRSPPDNSRIQIIETLEDLPRARKHQYAAFVRNECSLLVWADSASRVIDEALDIEKKIIELI